MKEENTKKNLKISLSTFFLVIAIIVIIVMGYYLYITIEGKRYEEKQVSDLEYEINILENTVNTLQQQVSEKSNTSNTVNTNSMQTNNSTTNEEKQFSNEEIKKAFYLTKKVELKRKALIMHGYPGENMKTTEETIHLLEELKEYIGRIGLTYFTYLPGAPIYPENTLLESHGVYCDNQVPWGTKEEQQEVLLARKKLQKYIKENFPEK